MLKAYKYRIYPNKEQSVLLNKHFGCVRYVYNKGLQTKIEHYQTTGKTLSCFDLINNMLKQEKENNIWLKEVYSQSLQMSLRNLDNAFTRFFRSKKGFPKFKSRHKNINSCQFPQHVKIDFNNKRIILPKIGGVKTIFHRKFKDCNIKTVTVSKTHTNKYYVSVLIENEDIIPKKVKVNKKTTIGLDLGIKDFCITSNGEKTDNPKYLKNNLNKIKILQRQFSKKAKGGKNREKARIKLAKKHEYVKNVRNDFLHKVSSKLISENQTIIIEDLNIQGMIKNHKLAQSISDVSWSKFIEYLKYKAEWYGKNILEIGRFDPSSKMCSNCGNIKKDLTLKIRSWTCDKCKEEHDRDINAAMNIKKFGLIRYNKYKDVKIGQELPDFKPVENLTSDKSSCKRRGIKLESEKQEALILGLRPPA